MTTAVAAQQASAQAAPPLQSIGPITAIKVILIGDSTVQAGSGWGGAFCGQHVTSLPRA